MGGRNTDGIRTGDRKGDSETTVGDRYREDRRQECGQAVRRQSGDRRTDRQAKDRQATSVYFEVLCRPRVYCLDNIGLQEG